MYNIFRSRLKKLILSKFYNALQTPAARETLSTISRSANYKENISYINTPYNQDSHQSLKRSEAPPSIIITGRFRSGSTMLWNIFRHLEGFTSYYEPFNERQWFNSDTRGDKVDNTHQGTTNYWDEYLNHKELINLYDENWIRYGLYMKAHDSNYAMKMFINHLIDKTEDTAAMQFNRIDFRLPWIRQNFPDAKIIHIYRNPRDQWCSFVGKTSNFPMHNDSEFKDRFYLNIWIDDLTQTFPFLHKNIAKHPYQQFYLLWRLSYIFGQNFSDFSISLEELSQNPSNSLDKLFSTIKMNYKPNEHVFRLVKPQISGKWKLYAPSTWFDKHEEYCECILRDFFKNST